MDLSLSFAVSHHGILSPRCGRERHLGVEGALAATVEGLLASPRVQGVLAAGVRDGLTACGAWDRLLTACVRD